MARDVEVGDKVYVPRTLLGMDLNHPSVFYEADVVEKIDRSVRIKLHNGNYSKKIAVSHVSKNVGVIIFRIGDYKETLLLNPLYNSVVQFLKMLLPDDHVRALEIRTLEELIYYWNEAHAAYQQLVIIGHGSSESITFGENRCRVDKIVEYLDKQNVVSKEIISLCCETGKAPFAKTISFSNFCDFFIAPFGSLHGCTASQFAQNYFMRRMLAAETPTTAFKNTRSHIKNAATFRFWKNGELKAGKM